MTAPVGGVALRHEELDGHVHVGGRLLKERVGGAVARGLETLPHGSFSGNKSLIPALQGFFEILFDQRDLELIQLLPQWAQEDVTPFREMLEDIRVDCRETLRWDVAGSKRIEVRIVLGFKQTGSPHTPPGVDVRKQREAAASNELL